MTSWQELRIADLGKVVTGKTPPTSQPEFYGGKTPFLTPTDMDGRRTINKTLRYLSDEGVSKVHSSLLPAGSVSVSCIGSDMGKAVIVGSDTITNQQINSIIVGNEFDNLFVYYNLSGRKDEIQFLASGGVQPIMNKTDFSNLPISIPNIEEQKVIASVLGALDDKIENNRRMNETLEEMAQAIFQSWFIDFDPVRAKMEGRPTGLSNDISDLFPDELVESEIGKIPRGWNITKFSEVADIQNGYAFKSKDWNENGEIPVVKIGNVKPMLVDVASCSRVDASVVNGLERFKLSAGDALIGMTGYVGEVGLIPSFGESPYLNQRVGKLVSINQDDYPYMVIFTRRTEFKNEVENLGTGSAQANVSAGNIKDIRIILPSPKIRIAFGKLVLPMIDRILISDAESHTLSELRDTLLPKLMSGKLRVKDAECEVEDAL